MEFAEAQRALIKTGEGSVPHLYLDTRGFVTVGVGNMIPNVEAAQTLAFVRRDGGAPAGAEDIAADYDAVKDRPYGQGYTAASFKPHTALDLPETEIDALLDRRIAEFEAGLRSDFGNYDNYPDRARLGLLDMAFNLGNHGLITKFPTFTTAARAGDWTTCAQECRRIGVGDARNAEVRKLFEDVDEPV